MKHFAKFSLRSVLLCVFSVFLFQSAFSQVTISGTSYSENFDGVGTGLPTGWTVRTGATASALGTAATLTTVATAWNNTTGAFKNSASADGLTSASTSAVQSTSTDRVICVRQGSAFGDPGSAFVLQLANTNGLTNIQISFKLQSLDISSVRAVTWIADYGIGTAPTTFTPFSTGTITTGGSTFTNNTITATLGNTAFNNVSNVWIRIVTLGASTGSGNRPTTGIDDFALTSSFVAPNLVVNPSSITNLTYIGGSSTSAAQSYTLSGSALTSSAPVADTITVKAPADFEISKTSANTGFADSLKIIYTTTTLTATQIYVRLKLGLPINTYGTLNITHKGGGVTSPPPVSVSGSVTSVPPPSIMTTGSLLPFYTVLGMPSPPQSYTVSGSNLLDDIKIKALTGFQIKTGAGSYVDSLVLTQSSGSVANTTIDVRLKGILAGTFTGNIINKSTTATTNIAVNGTVIATIASVRLPIPEQNTYTGSSVTVAGRVSVRFGNNKFYVQDATGGVAIFSSTGSGIAQTNGIVAGDSVILTGVIKRFNGEIEIVDPTFFNKTAGSGASTTPALFVFDSNNPPSGINLATFLDVNEGRRVKIISTNLVTTGSFTASTNYPISACNGQGDSEIRIDVAASQTLTSTTIPTATQDITGVIGHFITPTGAVNILQIFPSSPSDFSNSSISCPVVIPTSAASCGALAATSYPVDSTLDVTAWNVEWLGNTTTSPNPLGPTNDAQQMTNVMAVLNATKADVFCIEEVCDHNQFIARVGTDLPGYGVSCQTAYYSHFFDTPENPSDAKTFSQKVCFVYKTAIVSPVNAEIKSLLSDVYTYNPPAGPSNWASGRLPYLFVANVTLAGITKKIHFVGLHAKSGSALADYNRRKQDIIDMKAKLDSNTVYANANIIILGDYNDDLDTSIAASKPSSFKNFVTDNVRYNQVSKALSDCKVSSTAKYPDIIDHFMTSNEIGKIPTGTQAVTPSISDIYYLEKTINVSRPINYVANYTTSTSDHYPVNARFKFGIPATIKSVASGNWSVPATWDCNCIPQSVNSVIVDTPHTVTVDTASLAKNVDVKGILNYVSALMLTLGL